MARGRFQTPKHSSQRRSGSLGSIAREEQWRTGRKEPGGLLRAFELKYPNRKYSSKLGPKLEND